MKSLTERVNYAARVIKNGRPTSRAFDDCFENGDGDEVVRALVRKSKENPILAANLPKYIDQTCIDKFTNPPSAKMDRFKLDSESGFVFDSVDQAWLTTAQEVFEAMAPR